MKFSFTLIDLIGLIATITTAAISFALAYEMYPMSKIPLLSGSAVALLAIRFIAEAAERARGKPKQQEASEEEKADFLDRQRDKK